MEHAAHNRRLAAEQPPLARMGTAAHAPQARPRVMPSGAQASLYRRAASLAAEARAALESLQAHSPPPDEHAGSTRAMLAQRIETLHHALSRNGHVDAHALGKQLRAMAADFAVVRARSSGGHVAVLAEKIAALQRLVERLDGRSTGDR